MNRIDARPPDQSPRRTNAVQAARAWRPRLGNEDLTALVLFILTVLLIFSSRLISPSLGRWDEARAILCDFDLRHGGRHRPADRDSDRRARSFRGFGDDARRYSAFQFCRRVLGRAHLGACRWCY